MDDWILRWLLRLLVVFVVVVHSAPAPQYDKVTTKIIKPQICDSRGEEGFIRTNISRSVAPNPPPRLNDEAGHRERHGRDRETLIETKAGSLRGLKRLTQSPSGAKEVFIYYGIPFAKPPVGPLRFKKPVKLGPWSGTLPAVHMPQACVQETYQSFPDFRGETMWNPNTNISEDCLYLNIWTPKWAVRNADPTPDGQPNEGLPVLVWIYGGGYMSGTSTLDVYNADILATENNVVVITINYRVGAFGFLYLGNDEAPGNMGMYDQVMALEWIKENIARFGGNPSSVTLFGESAGGGSVSFHLLSPLSRHLLHRGILQSGTINAPWSIMEPEVARKNALDLARDCGCNDTTMSEVELVVCLRDVGSGEISVKQWNSYTGILGFPSAPTIDGHFLPRHPIQMLKDGDFAKKTPIILGSNLNEGTYWIVYDFMSYFKKEGPNCLPRDKFVEIVDTIFKDRTQLEREAIIFQYSNWEEVGDSCKYGDSVADVVGDYFFICPSNHFAQLYSDHGADVYYYYFTHRTSSNPWGDWMGVMHADEIEYVFGLPLNNSKEHTRGEQALSRRVMRYFTRFAATGVPVEESEEWPLYTRNEPHYFVLNGKGTGTGKGPRAQNCAFWNDFMPLITPGTTSLRGKCSENWSSGASSILPRHHLALAPALLILILLTFVTFSLNFLAIS